MCGCVPVTLYLQGQAAGRILKDICTQKSSEKLESPGLPFLSVVCVHPKYMQFTRQEGEQSEAVMQKYIYPVARKSVIENTC